MPLLLDKEGWILWYPKDTYDKTGKTEYNTLFSCSSCNIVSLITSKKGGNLSSSYRVLLKDFYYAGLDELRTYKKIDSAIKYMNNNCELKTLRNIRNKVKSELNYSERINAMYEPSLNIFNIMTIIIGLFVLISDIIFNDSNLFWEKFIVIFGVYIIMIIIAFGNKIDRYSANKYQLSTKFLKYLEAEIEDMIYIKETTEKKEIY